MQVRLERGNPWVRDMAERVPVLEPLRALKGGDPSVYVNYWEGRTKRTFPEDRLAMLGSLLEDIGSNGYNPETARAMCEAAGYPYGEIRLCCELDGRLGLSDGNHRFSAWYIGDCDQALEAEVVFYHPEWEELLRGAAYQPYDHPLANSEAYTRQGLERYRAVASHLAGATVNRMMVNLELGSCLGMGMEILAKGGPVYGCEHNTTFRALAERRFDILGDPNVKGHTKPVPMDRWRSVVGLSVWHHLATSVVALNAWAYSTRADRHYIELPEPGSKTWKEGFLREIGPVDPREVILEVIRGANGYTTTEEIYRDPQYADRVTLLLTR